MLFSENKNKEIEVETVHFLMEEQIQKCKQEELLAKQQCIEIGIKLHHLLRTECIPGVYSLKNSKNCRYKICFGITLFLFFFLEIFFFAILQSVV